MTEKEKMLAGELYKASDPELVGLRLRAKALCREYNLLSPAASDFEAQRRGLLEALLGGLGAVCSIEPSFFCDYGFNIELGNNFYSNHNLVILDVARVRIGDNVKFGPNCGVYAASHPLDHHSRNVLGIEIAKPVTIEDNVWVGGSACIMPGVTIGAGAVIGAGSVVTKSIPPYTLAVGNPCRVVREI